MSFNPYAPPVAESPVPSHGHHSSPLAADGALALWVGDTLPDVCLKCGALDGLERRRLPLSRRPFWVYGFLFVGLITFFVVDSGMPKGWLSGCLCRHCLGRYSAAQWARWSIALPLVAWFFTLIMASSIGGEDALGEVLVLTLFLQVAVLFTVFAWLVQKFFVAPRILDLLGLTGLGAHGIGMRVAGIHRAGGQGLLRRAFMVGTMGEASARGVHASCIATSRTRGHASRQRPSCHGRRGPLEHARLARTDGA